MSGPASSGWKQHKHRREAVRRILLHLTLLTGGIVFGFPFFWLVSTTFKADREIFVFPPNWMPDSPYYATHSPFVSGAEYPPMRRPDTVSRQRWGRLQPRIRAALLAASRKLAPPFEGIRFEGAAAEQLVRGLWAEIEPAVPDRLLRGDAGALLDHIAGRVNEDLVRKVCERFYKQVLVGELHILDESNDELVASSADTESKAWAKSARTDCEIGEMREHGGESGVLLSYSGDSAPRLVRRLVLTAPAQRMDRISLALRDDESWRHLDIVVRTQRATYRASRPFIMGNGQWQEVTWTFTKPFDPASRDILLEGERDAAPPAAAASLGEDDVILELSIIPRSRLQTIYDKYARNYREAMRYVPFWTYVRNSFYLTGMNIVGQLFACSLVAYAFSRLRWYGRDVFFVILLSTMMLPPQVTMVPVFLIFKELGWYNTLKPLWVPSLFGSAFFIFLLRQFFMTIPRDLEDAAKIDGCGPFGIYWRVMLPLVKPALATVAIFQFLGTWNDFMGPLIYVGDERLTPLSLGLFNFRMEHAAEWGMLMAASLLMTLPAVIIFFFAQRYFIQGITLTGVKG